MSLTGISRRTGRISLAQNPPLIGPTSFLDSSVAILDFNLSQWGRLSEDLKMKLPYLFAFICWVQTVQGCLRLSFQRPPSRSIHTCCSVVTAGQTACDAGYARMSDNSTAPCIVSAHIAILPVLLCTDIMSSGVLQPCSPGYYRAVGMPSSNCSACEINFISAAAAASCVKCGFGTYTPAPASIACVPCPSAGNFASLTSVFFGCCYCCSLVLRCALFMLSLWSRIS